MVIKSFLLHFFQMLKSILIEGESKFSNQIYFLDGKLGRY